jgi:hypothetical protein
MIPWINCLPTYKGIYFSCCNFSVPYMEEEEEHFSSRLILFLNYMDIAVGFGLFKLNK